MPERYKLIILPEAQQDIKDIVLYIAKDLAAPKAANRIRELLKNGIKSLSEMPDRASLVNRQPWRDMGVHRLRVKYYYIYYIISDTEHTVKILAVIHVERDQKSRLEERGKDYWT